MTSTRSFNGTDPNHPQRDPSRWKVLLVDDDHDDALLLRRTLAMVLAPGTIIDIVHGSAAARAAMVGDTYNLVLVDFWLGSETSIGLIRDIASTHSCKLVLVTGIGSDNIEELGYSVGILEYADKSDISIQALSDLMQRLAA